ncbi:hypothetical protein PICMEDRAFT_25799, partial [Pichia membranifaciens NRRL Y-2026]
EGRSLTVDRRVVEVSVYVRNLLRNLHSPRDQCIEIPLDNISYDTMELILRWCKHYYDEVGNWPDNVMDDYQARVSRPVLDLWEREFLDVDAETLKKIILASNFLNIRPLLDTTCKIIAELFRGKSPREIINAFN